MVAAMQVTIDFHLNYRFGVVERVVFRLVMNGFSDAQEIALSLPIFSDAVIANAIKNLVNQQILSANIDAGRLSLSEAMIALISACLNKSFEITIPVSLTNDITDDVIILTEKMWETKEIQAEVMNLKKAILREMLPEIKLDILCNSLDFVIKRKQGDANE